MNASNTVKALLNLCEKKQIDLAVHFGMLPQSMANKMARGSWSIDDLLKVADFTDCKIGFSLKDGTFLAITEERRED